MLSSRIGGWSLVGAALLLFVAELVRSDHSQSKYGAQLADVAAARTPELVAAALFLVGGLLLVPASIGIARLTSGRGARLITLGSVLLGVAALWMAAGRATFALMLYALTAPGFSNATAASALDQIGNSPAFSVLLVALLALLLSPIVLGVGLWRAGRTPLWLVAVWPVATVAFLAVETSKAGDAVTFGAMMAVLAALGVATARGDARGEMRTLEAQVVAEP